MNRRSIIDLAAILAALTFAPTALAQSPTDIATARELTEQGNDALAKHEWATAADRFSRADALFHAPTITIGLARANAKLGKLVSAQEQYSRVAHETLAPNASTAFVNAVEDAKRELEALRPRVPAVIIVVKGTSNPKVTLDGEDVPLASLGVKRFVDPGKHVVRAVGVGLSPIDASVVLSEGKTETVTIELKPGPGGLDTPPAPTSPSTPSPNGGATTLPPPVEESGSGPLRKTIGFVGIAIGGAGLVLGGVTGGLALSKHSELAKACPTGHCMPMQQTDLQPTVNSYHLLGTLSTVGFVAGGVLAATGIILVATAPRGPQTTGLVIGPSYVGAQGTF